MRNYENFINNNIKNNWYISEFYKKEAKTITFYKNQDIKITWHNNKEKCTVTIFKNRIKKNNITIKIRMIFPIKYL